MIDLSKHTLIIGKNPVLNTPAEPFDFANPPVDPAELATHMVKIMYDLNGYGLSACQIGLPWQVFVMAGPQAFACFNPVVVNYSAETISLEEGCLSFPGMVVDIERPRHVRLRYSMPNGEKTTNQFTGMSARVVQHEMDHLAGKLMFDHLPRFKREKLLKKFSKESKNGKAKVTPKDTFFTTLEHAARIIESERSSAKNGTR